MENSFILKMGLLKINNFKIIWSANMKNFKPHLQINEV